MLFGQTAKVFDGRMVAVAVGSVGATVAVRVGVSVSVGVVFSPEGSKPQAVKIMQIENNSSLIRGRGFINLILLFNHQPVSCIVQ